MDPVGLETATARPALRAAGTALITPLGLERPPATLRLTAFAGPCLKEQNYRQLPGRMRSGGGPPPSWRRPFQLSARIEPKPSGCWGTGALGRERAAALDPLLEAQRRERAEALGLGPGPRRSNAPESRPCAASCLRLSGRGPSGEEFVHAGWSEPGEVTMATMGRAACKTLGCFFAGELLDIDGVDGGFNFPAMLDLSWLAGQRDCGQRRN